MILLITGCGAYLKPALLFTPYMYNEMTREGTGMTPLY